MWPGNYGCISRVVSEGGAGVASFQEVRQRVQSGWSARWCIVVPSIVLLQGSVFCLVK